MVANVSLNCTSTAANRASSSSLSLQAIALAAAVIEAVNSHGFILIVPFILYAKSERIKRQLLLDCRTTLISSDSIKSQQKIQ